MSDHHSIPSQPPWRWVTGSTESDLIAVGEAGGVLLVDEAGTPLMRLAPDTGTLEWALPAPRDAAGQPTSEWTSDPTRSPVADALARAGQVTSRQAQLEGERDEARAWARAEHHQSWNGPAGTYPPEAAPDWLTTPMTDDEVGNPRRPAGTHRPTKARLDRIGERTRNDPVWRTGDDPDNRPAAQPDAPSPT